MIIILLGPPGSGKGTSAKIICDTYNLLHISTGDLLRAKIKQDNKISDEIADLLSKGQFVSDDIVNKIVKEIIDNQDNKNKYSGLLFDGYPRTITQAEYLDELLQSINQKVDNVLLFSIPNNMIVKRVSARRIDKTTGKIYNLIFNPPPKEVVANLEQRSDDTEETILNRLKIYQEQTEPLIDYYKYCKNRDIILKIDASGDVKDTQNIINKALKNAKT